MISAYAFRLVCLSLAVFFLLHAAMAAAISAILPAAIRRAEKWRAASAARWMLALRLLPAAVAAFAVGAICIRSYLRLEPKVEQEEIGIACLAIAAMGAATWLASMIRAASAMLQSMRQVRAWRKQGVEATVHGSRVWRIEGAGRMLAVAGVFRQTTVVSTEIARALAPDQLAVALRHERAHGAALDNFKRLLMLLAPDAWLLGRAERAWTRFTEWSADDRAANGDSNASLLLAAALVEVARLKSAPMPPLAVAFVTDGGDLETRVDRLLSNRVPRRVPAIWNAAWLLGGASIAALALHPATLSVAYSLLEKLIE